MLIVLDEPFTFNFKKIEREISWLMKLINNFLGTVTSDAIPDEAINWGDLKCVDMNAFINPKTGIIQYVAYIEEADPSAIQLKRLIRDKVLEDTGLFIDIETSW